MAMQLKVTSCHFTGSVVLRRHLLTVFAIIIHSVVLYRLYVNPFRNFAHIYDKSKQDLCNMLYSTCTSLVYYYFWNNFIYTIE